jgi:ElaB/YqjD/DUF883 family membrane-anchored ribosome-binding protein
MRANRLHLDRVSREARKDPMTTANAKSPEQVLREDINQLREDLGQLRSDVSSLAGDLLGAAKDGMSDAVDTAKQRGKEVADNLEEQIVEHPLAAVGIALGVGLLLGALIRRS